MLDLPVNFGGLSHAIQLALAPVFLLTGIAGILNVMMGRLARIVDRGRRLAETQAAPDPRREDPLRAMLLSLDRRRHLANAAITACTASALLVCTVIATLFLEVLLQIELGWAAGVLFTGSTLTLVVGLAYFLREVQLASQTVQFTIPAGQP